MVRRSRPERCRPARWRCVAGAPNDRHPPLVREEPAITSSLGELAAILAVLLTGAAKLEQLDQY